MNKAAPRPASTVLLLRDGIEGLEVFMVRRYRLMGFAGDALVFPGGRLDEADSALASDPSHCAGAPDEDLSQAAFRVGALRETFEEGGILLAREEGSAALVGGARAKALGAERQAVAEGRFPFAALLARERLELAIDLLVPFAHWITPPVYPKRYDTMFYLAAAPANQEAAHDGQESVDSLWITPVQALAAGDAGTVRLEFATRRNLEKIGRSSRVEQAMAAARGARLVTVLPVIEDAPGGRIAHLPPEADYGGAVFDFAGRK